jgi:hypothetical protein
MEIQNRMHGTFENRQYVTQTFGESSRSGRPLTKIDQNSMTSNNNSSDVPNLKNKPMNIACKDTVKNIYDNISSQVKGGYGQNLGFEQPQHYDGEEYSDACSAVDLSYAEIDVNESSTEGKSHMLTQEQVQEMMEEQNQKHQDIMRLQEQQFRMQVQRQNQKFASMANLQQNASHIQSNSF